MRKNNNISIPRLSGFVGVPHQQLFINDSYIHTMKFSRLKELFNYALWLWLLAPLVFTVSVSDYKLFLLKGVGFAAVLALAFYGLDILVNRILKRTK